MSGPTKTEEAVLQAAYYWARNPTDREAKRALYSAVMKDTVAESKRRERALDRVSKRRVRS